MKRLYLALFVLIFLIGADAFAKNGNGNGNGNSNTYVTVQTVGNFEDEDSWQNGNVPDDFENIDQAMTINGTITRNGNLNPVSVVVNGTFNVDGDYENDRSDGLDIKSGAKVEIFGNLNSSAAVNVAKDGLLIVHGNLATTNAGIHIKGDLIVKGDFSTDSKTQVNNSGNLIAGGDFLHEGGGLNVKNDDIYILDPNANIVDPGWGTISNGDYSDLDDFRKDEEGTDLGNIVDEVGLLKPVARWVGTDNPDWSNKNNWKNQQLPDSKSVVAIESSDNTPLISSDVTISELRISDGASVAVNPGISLEIRNDVYNRGTIVVKSTNDKLASLMLPEAPAKAGDVNVRLTLASDQYFYISTPLKEANSSWFKPENLSKDYVYIVENDRWVRMDDMSTSIPEMFGIGVYYYDNDKHLNYSGSVQNEDVTVVPDDRGYFLMGNPFPTAIDWENPAGWIREGFSNTMWSRITIGGERVVQTYNNNGDVLPGVWTYEPAGYDVSTMRHIPPYQAVWVKKDTTASVPLTVKRSARIKDSDAPLKGASQEASSYDLIRITASNAHTKDATVLYFNELFSESKGSEDSEKRFNSSSKVPEIYTRINSESIAINGQTLLNADKHTYPISVRNRVEGNVTITFNLQEFSANYNVFLEDKATGAWVDLATTNEFVYSPAQMGVDNDRFVLHFEKIQQVATNVNQPDFESSENIEIIGHKEYAQVQISNEVLQTSDAKIDILDMRGRLLNRITTGQTQSNVDLPDNKGIYIIRVSAGKVMKTKKVLRGGGF